MKVWTIYLMTKPENFPSRIGELVAFPFFFFSIRMAGWES